MKTNEKAYDIKERTLQFAVEIANVEEANGARTKREFANMINIAKREARETLYWLRVISEAKLVDAEHISEIATEANELVSILTTIVRRADGHS